MATDKEIKLGVLESKKADIIKKIIESQIAVRTLPEANPQPMAATSMQKMLDSQEATLKVINDLIVETTNS